MKKKKAEQLPIPPEDYACYISGQYFKIGKHNRVYVHRLGEWVVSRGMSIDKIHKVIESNASLKKVTICDPIEHRKYVTHCRRDLKV